MTKVLLTSLVLQSKYGVVDFKVCRPIVPGNTSYILNGTIRDLYTTGIFKRLVKPGCPINVVVNIRTCLNTTQGLVSADVINTSITKIDGLIFKQRYKQPVKKLMKALESSTVAGYTLEAISSSGYLAASQSLLVTRGV